MPAPMTMASYVTSCGAFALARTPSFVAVAAAWQTWEPWHVSPPDSCSVDARSASQPLAYQSQCFTDRSAYHLLSPATGSLSSGHAERGGFAVVMVTAQQLSRAAQVPLGCVYAITYHHSLALRL